MFVHFKKYIGLLYFFAIWVVNYDHHRNLNSNGRDYLAGKSTSTKGASRDPGKQSGFGKCQRLQESLGGPGLEKGQ